MIIIKNCLRRRFLPACFFLAPLFTAALPASGLAHDLNSSYSAIVVTADSLQAVFTFDLSDLNKAFHLDVDGDANVSQEELRAAMPAMYDYVAAQIVIATNFSPASLERRPGGFSRDDFGNVFINFIFFKELNGLPAEILLQADFFEKFGASHKNLVKVVAGDQTQQAVFSAENFRQRFAVGGKVSLWAQIGEFAKLGVEHIFLGYDHLMFLFALIVIGGRLLSLVKIVTAFTVAHSLTLILAALAILKLPPPMIETGIALSIAYVAAENFFVTDAQHRWLLTFIFGLVHGFGFANVLSDLGLPASGLVPSLLAFNLGVEMGQLCIVAICFPLTLWLARQKFQRSVVFACSAAILLFGLGWFVERAFGLAFMPL